MHNVINLVKLRVTNNNCTTEWIKKNGLKIEFLRIKLPIERKKDPKRIPGLFTIIRNIL